MCHPYNWKLISYSQRVWHSILIRQIFSIWFLFLLYFTGIYLCAFYISPPIDTTIDSISHLKFLPHSYIHNFLESLILVLFQKGKVVLRRLSDLSKVTWLFCLFFFFFIQGIMFYEQRIILGLLFKYILHIECSQMFIYWSLSHQPDISGKELKLYEMGINGRNVFLWGSMLKGCWGCNSSSTFNLAFHVP